MLFLNFMKPRYLIRKAMIAAIGDGSAKEGEKLIARQWRLTPRGVRYWGEDPDGNGRCPPEQVEDWLLTHPKTEKFRREYLMTINGPAGFVPVQKTRIQRLRSFIHKGFDAIAGEAGI